jgi:hypothetical protein
MFTALIRNNATGEVRPHPQDGEWDEVMDYLWLDGGNYSCDCNRHLFFFGDDADESRDCGNTAFSVRVVDADGLVLAEDENFTQKPEA